MILQKKKNISKWRCHGHEARINDGLLLNCKTQIQTINYSWSLTFVTLLWVLHFAYLIYFFWKLWSRAQTIISSRMFYIYIYIYKFLVFLKYYFSITKHKCNFQQYFFICFWLKISFCFDNAAPKFSFTMQWLRCPCYGWEKIKKIIKLRKLKNKIIKKIEP